MMQIIVPRQPEVEQLKKTRARVGHVISCFALWAELGRAVVLDVIGKVK